MLYNHGAGSHMQVIPLESLTPLRHVAFATTSVSNNIHAIRSVEAHSHMQVITDTVTIMMDMHMCEPILLISLLERTAE